MHNALNPQELLYAQRLQRRGLLLREIAAELDVSFQAVCLALYGGNESTAARRDVLNDEGKDEASSARDALKSHSSPAGTQAPPVDTYPLANAGEGANGAIAAAPVDPASREADDAGRQQLAASGLTGDGVVASDAKHRDAADEPVREAPAPQTQSDAAIEAERHALAAEFHPAQRFRLVSDDGQTLHQSLHVLTRLPSFYWRGTAEQLAAVRRRRPQWAHLKPVAVTS